MINKFRDGKIRNTGVAAKNIVLTRIEGGQTEGQKTRCCFEIVRNTAKITDNYSLNKSTNKLRKSGKQDDGENSVVSQPTMWALNMAFVGAMDLN